MDEVLTWLVVSIQQIEMRAFCRIYKTFWKREDSISKIYSVTYK